MYNPKKNITVKSVKSEKREREKYIHNNLDVYHNYIVRVMQFSQKKKKIKAIYK